MSDLVDTISVPLCAHGSAVGRKSGSEFKRIFMRLSAEMYDQIVAALKSDSHRERDKRREPRVGLAGEAALVSVNSKGERLAGTVRVRDVSASGIGLFFGQRLSKGQRFVVQLQNQHGEPVWLVCMTCYCRAVDGGRFSVGGRTQQVLRADQIQKVESDSRTAQAAAAAAVPVPQMQVKMMPPKTDPSDIERISRAILG